MHERMNGQMKWRLLCFSGFSVVASPWASEPIHKARLPFYLPLLLVCLLLNASSEPFEHLLFFGFDYCSGLRSDLHIAKPQILSLLQDSSVSISSRG